jgi:hypothetical protein
MKKLPLLLKKLLLLLKKLCSLLLGRSCPATEEAVCY